MILNKVLLTLYNSMVNGASAQTLINIARESCQNPIAVCNCNLETIVYSQEKEIINDSTWTNYISNDEQLHYAFERQGMDLGLPTQISKRADPIIVENEVFENRFISCGIFWDSKKIGDILLLEYHRAFSDTDILLVKEFSRIFAYFLVNDIKSKCVGNPNTDIAVCNIINNNYIHPKTISRHLFQNKKNTPYIIVVIDINLRKSSNVHSSLFKQLSYEFPKDKLLFLDNKILMLSHYSEKIDWGKLENLLSLRELACGVSKPFSNIMDSRIYYEQALNALLYGNQYCRKKAIYFYQDFTLIHMLDVVNQNSPNNIMNFLPLFNKYYS